jgi:hypothetical protein
MSLSDKLEPTLTEIHDLIWDAEHEGIRPHWSKANFRNTTKLFMSCMMEFLWQHNAQKSQTDREHVATLCGNEFRFLIEKYTGIDSHSFYKENCGQEKTHIS